MRSFFDTNVLVYLFDESASEKKEQAQRLFETESNAGRVVLSTQVLQEFYVAVTRKLAIPLPSDVAEAIVRHLALLPIALVDSTLVLSAIARSRASRISFWDALIVEAAITSGSTRLFTEDLQHGQRIGDLEIVDPFRPGRSAP